jgi:nucleoid-associated protein YgaU
MIDQTPTRFHLSRFAGSKHLEDDDGRRWLSLAAIGLILSVIAVAAVILTSARGSEVGIQVGEQASPAVLTELPSSMIPEAASSTQPEQVSYIVKPGDTLWQIGETLKIEVSEISRANQLDDPDLIFPGQVLIIPQ